jgi:hypothetical protein
MLLSASAHGCFTGALFTSPIALGARPRMQAGSAARLEGRRGVTLIAWYLPAKEGKPTLLYFIGNNGRTASRADKIRKFSRSGYGVFMLN